MSASLRAVLLVAFGSAVGGAARAMLVWWTAARIAGGFPLGVLLVNVIGSFVFGVAIRYGVQTNAMSDATRMLLTTGLCGGFTTFSTFSFDLFEALEDQQYGIVASYLLLSVGLGVLAMWAGITVGRALAK